MCQGRMLEISEGGVEKHTGRWVEAGLVQDLLEWEYSVRMLREPAKHAAISGSLVSQGNGKK